MPVSVFMISSSCVIVISMFPDNASPEKLVVGALKDIFPSVLPNVVKLNCRLDTAKGAVASGISPNIYNPVI